MALDSYAGLVESIAGWLNRRDLAERIPDFIRLCEDDLASKLRDRRMHRAVDATVSAQPLRLPDDWLEAVSIYGATGRPLVPVTAHQLHNAQSRLLGYGGTQVAGDPSDRAPRFLVTGNTLELHPAPSAPQTIQMVYFARLPRLNNGNPTNWLLEEDSGVYLYGSLIQAEPYLKNDARMATWAALYRDRVDTRNQASAAAELSGGPLRRTRRGFR